MDHWECFSKNQLWKHQWPVKGRNKIRQFSYFTICRLGDFAHFNYNAGPWRNPRPRAYRLCSPLFKMCKKLSCSPPSVLIYFERVSKLILGLALRSFDQPVILVTVHMKGQERCCSREMPFHRNVPIYAAADCICNVHVVVCWEMEWRWTEIDRNSTSLMRSRYFQYSVFIIQ